MASPFMIEAGDEGGSGGGRRKVGWALSKKKIRELRCFNLESNFSSNILFRQMSTDTCLFSYWQKKQEGGLRIKLQRQKFKHLQE